MDYIIAATIVFIYVCFLKKNIFKTNKKVGDLGENRVKLELSKLNNNYIIQNDVRLPGSQIDHLVFYKQNIFVIETKFWKGPITGSLKDQYWTSNNKRMKSPVQQNRRHCLAVKKAYPLYDIVNIVVFANKHNFPHSENVIHVTTLVQFIKDYSV